MFVRLRECSIFAQAFFSMEVNHETLNCEHHNLGICLKTQSVCFQVLRLNFKNPNFHILIVDYQNQMRFTCKILLIAAVACTTIC